MQVKRKNFIQLISEDSIKEKVNQIANEISCLLYTSDAADE